ncbi:MAG: 4'-phosphopantetheinyl transferase superfamily protein [Nitriliruptoraceae bacterium]
MSGSPGFVTGCDLVDIDRLAAAISRRPALAQRVFTDRELADARRGDPLPEVVHARLAARFAAKEAARKAFDDLRLPFHAVEVRSNGSGAPQLLLHGEPCDLAVSLSHDGGVAMAVVVGPATVRDVARTEHRPRPSRSS